MYAGIQRNMVEVGRCSFSLPIPFVAGDLECGVEPHCGMNNMGLAVQLCPQPHLLESPVNHVSQTSRNQTVTHWWTHI